MEDADDFWAGILDFDPAILRSEAGISQVGDLAAEALYDREFDFANTDQHPDHPSTSHVDQVDINWSAPEPAATSEGLGATGLGPIPSVSTALSTEEPEAGVNNSTDPLAERSPTQSRRGGRGRGRARASNPSSNALANRRFHVKRKEREREFDAEMRELEGRISRLMQDKREVEVRNKILMTDLTTWQEHVEMLGSIQDVKRVQRCAIMQKVADLIGCAENKTFTLEEAMLWTVQDFFDHYQMLVDREKYLCSQALHDPTSGALQAIEELMLKQKAIKLRSGLGTCMYGSLMGYNHQVTRLGTHPLPTTRFWLAILEGLRLNQRQEDEILDSYRWMHQSLCKLAEERNAIILPQLSDEALSVEKDRMHHCRAATLLFRSLRNEQTIVIGFQSTLVKVLTKWQEAVMDSQAYPWAPQWLVLCSLICEKRGEKVPVFPTFNNHAMDYPLLPELTAIQIIEMPILGLGLGICGRQSTLMCPFFSLLSKNHFPNASPEKFVKMKLCDMIMGNEKTLDIWGWLQKVKEEGRLVENTLVEPN